jgi:hypothetical protein
MTPDIIYFVLIPAIVAAMAISFFAIGKSVGRQQERKSLDSKVLEKHGVPSR